MLFLAGLVCRRGFVCGRFVYGCSLFSTAGHFLSDDDCDRHDEGIEALGSSTASIFCLFEPIGSVICGALFLHENLTLAKILGCLIIILAVVLLILAGRQKSER